MLRLALMMLALLALPVLLFASAGAMEAAGLPAPSPYFTMGMVLGNGLLKRGLKKLGVTTKTLPWVNVGATLVHTAVTAASPGVGGFVGQFFNQFFNNWGGHRAVKGITSAGTGGKFKF